MEKQESRTKALVPAGQPRAAISSAKPIYAISLAEDAAKRNNKVLCPWCLANSAEYVFMTRTQENQSQLKCQRCGKTLGVD